MSDTFSSRNDAWDGVGVREFRQLHSRSSGPRVWQVWVVGNTINYQWGLLNGAMQLASETCTGVNLGKKNEISPREYALYRAREMCRKKHWEGYREIYLTAEGLVCFRDEPVKAEIDFDNLPLSLCFYKPDNSMGSGITKKALAGNVWYARKANGMMFVIAKGSGPAKMYSRKMLRNHDLEKGQEDLSWDRRFANIVGSADVIMPPNSILLGELVVIDRDGKEFFNDAQSLIKSLTPEVFQRLVNLENEGKHPAFYCWDVAFWDGQNLVSNAPVKDRFDLIHEVVDGPHIIPVQFFDSGFFPRIEEAIEHAKKYGWEGFVVVDPEGTYGDKAFNFKGKPDRHGAVCAKLKPAYEDDFIAFWDPSKGYGEHSTKGRYEGGIKSVALFQYNSKGEMVYISNVSSGLEESMKRDWAKPELYPQVWKIEYTNRRYQSQGDDTDAMDFARFIEVRTDKTVQECINKDL